MKFENYQEYVNATKEHYSSKKLTINPDLMILPEDIFNKFNGIIEFGAGGKNLVNKPKAKCDGNCSCTTKCDQHKD